MKAPRLNQIVNANTLDYLKACKSNSIHCLVTSPPYFGLRDYGTDPVPWETMSYPPMPNIPGIKVPAMTISLGQEPTLESFIGHLVLIFREARRVLHPTGTLWVNMGDSYCQNGKWGGSSSGMNNYSIDGGYQRSRRKIDGLKPKDMVMQPARLALALQADGWYLRSDIIWEKNNSMPESVNDRPTTNHEHIFILAKSKHYYYDKHAIAEPVKLSSVTRANRAVSDTHKNMKIPGQLPHSMHKARANGKGYQMPATKNKRTVWRVSTKGFPGAHFACVDAETECLTIGGWKRYHEINPGDVIFTYNMQSELLELQPIQKVETYPYNGNLISVFGRSSNMLMTPNHRCVVKTRNKQGGTYPPKIVKADELKSGMKFPVAAVLPDTELLIPNVPLEFFELLGWVLSDGQYFDNGGVWISQSLTAKPIHVAQLDKLADFFGDDMQRHQRDREEKGIEITYRIHRELRKRVRLFIPDKFQIPEHFLLLPSEYLRSFLDGFVGGDGHVRADGRITIIQKAKQPIDLIQAMYLRLGKSCVLSQRGNGIWSAFVTNADSRYFKNAHSSLIRDDYAYHGIVWCPVVKNTTWLARRGGRPFITGNTFPEALIEPMILAGCSPKVCPKCLSPWERQTEKVFIPQEDVSLERGIKGAPGQKAQYEDNQWNNVPRGSVAHKTIGWQPTCKCPPSPSIPSTVMDIFMGSGTTALVAMKNSLNYMGCDLNPEYVEMAQKRLSRPVQRDMFHGNKIPSVIISKDENE